ncbi:MAG: Spy/CpxP family protein refolding chaperone [Blastocatellia bacterium]|nr:Spy/CpxP family protein refolding chaperone [Blastocatellia bacterium]MCS7156287.1 Spy/CpxP family protein refolding chaperone [Blastocatellia bacterium]MCX7751363.1 Spy/CpxP family protein refolding chaperone [Blastocatellia bacterium]MDW8169075.1 Spy/CpxP family protein refolding chaperone [Acidobacteriota bacterium]MDW8255780.1 Spy/CpxP family protein refolding chaperone [Acidobacteriota bacterium]
MRSQVFVLLLLLGTWGGAIAQQSDQPPAPLRRAGVPSAAPVVGSQEPLRQIVLTRLAILRLLNLSQAQQQRVREIRRRYAAQLLELRQAVEERRDALREAIYGETLDPQRVEHALREFLERQAALLRLETQVELEFRQVLTPEQLAKFREIQNEELTIRRMRRELRQREERLRERLRRGS